MANQHHETKTNMVVKEVWVVYEPIHYGQTTGDLRSHAVFKEQKDADAAVLYDVYGKNCIVKKEHVVVHDNDKFQRINPYMLIFATPINVEEQQEKWRKAARLKLNCFELHMLDEQNLAPRSKALIGAGRLNDLERKLLGLH